MQKFNIRFAVKANTKILWEIDLFLFFDELVRLL